MLDRDDDRAVAYILALFFVSIIVAAMVWGLANPVFEQVDNAAANQTDSQEATDGQRHTSLLWDWYPFWIFLILFSGGLAAAVRLRGDG